MTVQTTTRKAFTQVNLLPQENREAQQVRQRVRLATVAGAVVVGILVFFSITQNARVSDLRDQVAQHTAANAKLQAQVTQLQPYETLRSNLQQAQDLEKTALTGDVSWSHILDELSGVVPPEVWLTSVAATTTPAVSTDGSTTAAPNVIGSLTFQGDSLDTHGLVRWLSRLVRVPGWVNAYVSTAQKSAVGTTTVWQFSSSVDLDPSVQSARGGGPR